MIKKLLLFLFVSILFCRNHNLNNSFNEFGISLFKNINSKSDSSFMISPASISYALMMVNYGASGKTSDQILSTLNIDKVHESNFFINHYDDIESKFQINNSIWIQEDKCYEPNLKYVNNIDSIFKGQISFVNFYKNRLSIINEINNWVYKKTLGTINEIVSDQDIKENTTLAILNSIYFKDSWQFPFDTSKSDLNIFYSKDYKSNIIFMNKKNKYAHYKNSNFHLLELPYKTNDVSMLIFLPELNLDIDLFLDNFNHSFINTSLDSLQYDLGKISIPKFELDYSVPLKDYLLKMGIIDAFSPNNANFDKFWDYKNKCKKYPPINYIDVINHKSFINIDEYGTEASAVTAVIINRVTSIRPNEYFTFNANRPFVYLIYDKKNNRIMFLGKYTG